MERHESIAVVVGKFLVEAKDVNPYASAAAMRQLDQMIRNGLSADLAHAAGRWRKAYAEAARAIPSPSREQPFPDENLMREVQLLKASADALSSRATQVTGLSAPANDRAWHRIRDNDNLLETLIACDYHLAGVGTKLDYAVPGHPKVVVEVLSELDEALEERRRLIARVSS